MTRVNVQDLIPTARGPSRHKCFLVAEKSLQRARVVVSDLGLREARGSLRRSPIIARLPGKIPN